MQAPTLTPVEQEIYNQAYIDALEFVDPVILNKSIEQPRVFVNMIPRGVYGLGKGLVQKQDVFYGDRGPQGGLLGWAPVQPFRPADGDDPGWNPCKEYDAELIEHGFEERTFTGFRRNRRTYDICINEMKWKDRFQEQIALVFGNIADIVIGEWDNLSQEAYVHGAKKYVMAGGSPNSQTFTYNPFTSTELSVTDGVAISSLQWHFLKWWHTYLALKARPSATGTISGKPSWTLVIDPTDFDNMVEADPQLVTTLNYARPQVLLEHMGILDEFKGFSLAFTMNAPRFNIVRKTGGLVYFDRVPQIVQEEATHGYKTEVNEDWLNAEYALGIIYLRDTLELQIPPAGPASPGAGLSFGITPALNGKFAWVNILHRTENPFGEIGCYFARLQAFLKPGTWAGESIVFLYKRCIQNPVIVCEPCGSDVEGEDDAILTASVATAVVDESETEASYTGFTVTLEGCLPCESPAEVTVFYGQSFASSVLGTIVKDENAPTYTITVATAADWVTLLGAAGSAKVQCGDTAPRG